uniref:Uncharacterized protein n=1 Tax=Rhizophora mucronata TaxID=61149 RepID=A0A2P2NQT8_RHIMU
MLSRRYITFWIHCAWHTRKIKTYGSHYDFETLTSRTT